MKTALVVSTPALLEARGIARWLVQGGLPGDAVRVDRAGKEWGVWVPGGLLERARTLFQKAISNPPPGPYRVEIRYGKGKRITHPIRSFRRAVARANRAVTAGAVEAIVYDRKWRGWFRAFRTGRGIRTSTNDRPSTGSDPHERRLHGKPMSNRTRQNPMKWMTKDILAKLPPIYGQEKVKDPIAYVKFFTPWGSASWFMTEYDPESRTFFGLYQDARGEELGYVSEDELRTVKGQWGLRVERDLHFRPTPLSKLRRIAMPNRPRRGARNPMTAMALMPGAKIVRRSRLRAAKNTSVSLTSAYEEWLDYHGKTVKLHGYKHRIVAQGHRQSYPYPDTVLTVHAEPVDKYTDYYLKTKRELGDDWSIDILGSNPELYGEVLAQLRKQAGRSHWVNAPRRRASHRASTFTVAPHPIRKGYTIRVSPAPSWAPEGRFGWFRTKSIAQSRLEEVALLTGTKPPGSRRNPLTETERDLLASAIRGMQHEAHLGKLALKEGKRLQAFEHAKKYAFWSDHLFTLAGATVYDIVQADLLSGVGLWAKLVTQAEIARPASNPGRRRDPGPPAPSPVRKVATDDWDPQYSGYSLMTDGNVWHWKGGRIVSNMGPLAQFIEQVKAGKYRAKLVPGAEGNLKRILLAHWYPSRPAAIRAMRSMKKSHYQWQDWKIERLEGGQWGVSAVWPLAARVKRLAVLHRGRGRNPLTLKESADEIKEALALQRVANKEAREGQEVQAAIRTGIAGGILETVMRRGPIRARRAAKHALFRNPHQVLKNLHAKAERERLDLEVSAMKGRFKGAISGRRWEEARRIVGWFEGTASAAAASDAPRSYVKRLTSIARVLDRAIPERMERPRRGEEPPEERWLDNPKHVHLPPKFPKDSPFRLDDRVRHEEGDVGTVVWYTKRGKGFWILVQYDRQKNLWWTHADRLTLVKRASKNPGRRRGRKRPIRMPKEPLAAYMGPNEARKAASFA